MHGRSVFSLDPWPDVPIAGRLLVSGLVSLASLVSHPQKVRHHLTFDLFTVCSGLWSRSMAETPSERLGYPQTIRAPFLCRVNAVWRWSHILGYSLGLDPWLDGQKDTREERENKQTIRAHGLIYFALVSRPRSMARVSIYQTPDTSRAKAPVLWPYPCRK